MENMCEAVVTINIWGHHKHPPMNYYRFNVTILHPFHEMTIMIINMWCSLFQPLFLINFIEIWNHNYTFNILRLIYKKHLQGFHKWSKKMQILGKNIS